MGQYRKKPVVVEAVQWNGSMAAVIDLMALRLGEWLIKGVKGEIYPCKPDIFAATYERVGDPQNREDQVVQVPWVSQVLNMYRLDCGPACWTMIARYCGKDAQLDDLIRMMHVENQLTSFTDALACWKTLGLKTLQGPEITTWPHMSMVRYPKLPVRYDPTFNGYHFIVILGTRVRNGVTYVVYHDPCWRTEQEGAYREMTMAQFQDAEAGVVYRATAVKP